MFRQVENIVQLLLFLFVSQCYICNVEFDFMDSACSDKSKLLIMKEQATFHLSEQSSSPLVYLNFCIMDYWYQSHCLY